VVKQPAQLGDLVALPRGGQDDQRLAAAFGAQVQLGAQPAAASPQCRIVGVCDPLAVLRGGLVAGAGGVLVGAHNAAVHEVAQPVQLPGSVGEPLGFGEEAIEDALATPAVEATGHRTPRTIRTGKVAPGRAGAVQPDDRFRTSRWFLFGRPVLGRWGGRRGSSFAHWASVSSRVCRTMPSNLADRTAH
jgi:hypothetical protein